MPYNGLVYEQQPNTELDQKDKLKYYNCNSLKCLTAIAYTFCQAQLIMKRFNLKHNLGKVKYLVSYHDGEKKHKDGSDFFDIACFKNKVKLNAFINGLLKQGYSNCA